MSLACTSAPAASIKPAQQATVLSLHHFVAFVRGLKQILRIRDVVIPLPVANDINPLKGVAVDRNGIALYSDRLKPQVPVSRPRFAFGQIAAL
jgi:hypothetical protein